MKIRDKKTKDLFVQYLNSHPNERFWQAIRNFWKAPYVLIADDQDLDKGEFKGLRETFYIEADEKRP